MANTMFYTSKVICLFVLLSNIMKSAALSAPKRMILSKSLSKADLQTSTLIPLGFDSDVISEKESMMSGDAIKENSGKYGSLCFVIRRPG